MSTKHFKSIKHFLEALEGMEADVRKRGLGNAVETGGRLVQGYARVNITNTFKAQSGNLAGSIRVEVSADADKATARIGPTAIYGRIQELGGTVRPLVKKELHWVDEDGKHHRAKSVTLPARPYLAPAMEDNEDRILASMADSLRRDIEGGI